MGLFAITLLFTWTYQTILPAYAKDRLGMGESGYALLGSVIGVGALCGALWVAGRAGAGTRPVRRHVVYGLVWAGGLCVFVLGFVDDLRLALPMLVLAGFCQVGFMATANGMVQESVPDAPGSGIMVIPGRRAMELLLLAIADRFAALAACGFGLLLLGILSGVSLAVVSSLVAVGASVGGRVFGFAVESARGILAIEGLASGQARRLRRELARVLRLAPPDSDPRACACVKQVDGAFVGVLRIFNTKGHYLLRAPGGTAVAVARRFSTTLADYRDRFPAEVGAPRAECPECNPRTCPLRQRGHQGPFAPMPA